jgi:hypothetical protein
MNKFNPMGGCPLKKTAMFGIMLVIVLTAGCTWPQENSAQQDASNIVTSSPLHDVKGYSGSDPASVDETIVFTESVNDSSQGYVKYSVRLTLLEVLRGTAAYEKMRQSNPYYMINIQEDREFMLARFKYELTDTSIAGASRLVNRDSFAIYRDGRFDQEDNTYIIGATPDLYGKIKKGQAVDGWFAFTVPKNSPSPLIVYRGTSTGSDGIWFKTA